MAIKFLIFFIIFPTCSLAQELVRPDLTDTTMNDTIKKIEVEKFESQKKLMELKLEFEKKKLLERKDG